MKGLKRLACTAAMILVPTTMTLGLSAPQASAATSNPSYCASNVQKIDASFGTKIPVILVHGWDGNPDQWKKAGGSTIFSSINKLSSAKVALNFSYTNWLGYRGHGQRLGKSIDCVSQISKSNGGTGKVILIGYSLGANIGQVALNEHDSSGNLIAGEVGQFITVANANSIGLIPVVPPPSGVLIHAIAGDIVKQYVKAGVVKSSEDTHGDNKVTVKGATSQKSGELSTGGGESVFKCHSKYSDKKYKHMTKNAPCRHGELLKYAPVQKDVITAITNYVNSLTPTPPTTATRPMYSGDLTFLLDDSWGDIGSYYGNSSSYSQAKDLSFMSGSNVFSRSIAMNWYYGITLAEYETRYANVDPSYGAVLGSAPPAIIGGRTPDYSVSYLSSYYYQNEWCYTDAQNVVCVDYTLSDEDLPTRSGPTISYIEPTTAVLKLFSTATWSN